MTSVIMDEKFIQKLAERQGVSRQVELLAKYINKKDSRLRFARPIASETIKSENYITAYEIIARKHDLPDWREVKHFTFDLHRVMAHPFETMMRKEVLSPEEIYKVKQYSLDIKRKKRNKRSKVKRCKCK